MKSHKELRVWQESIYLVKAVYAMTNTFPKEELFSLTNQIRRAVISIPSNIAEGHNRFGTKEYAQFIQIAYGSASEVDTQLFIAKELGYIDDKQYTALFCQLEYISRMLNKLLQSLRTKINSSPRP